MPSRRTLDPDTAPSPSPRLPRARSIAPVLAWLVGLGVVIALLLRYGIVDLVTSVAAIGWGLAAIVLFHLIPLALEAEAWRALCDRAWRPTVGAALGNRWIGESVGTMLPAGYLGGELVRLRVATLSGMRGVHAGGSIAADLTLAVVGQVLSSLMGVLCLVYLQSDGTANLIANVLIGLGVLTVLIATSIAALWSGLFKRLAQVLRFLFRDRDWSPLLGNAAALDATIQAIYRRRSVLVLSVGYRIVGSLAGAGEVWLALYFLGHPVGFVEALMLETLSLSIRLAAFFVPGGFGVLEGTLMLLGATVGLPPDVSLAVAIVKRLREFALGIPGLLVWNGVESGRLARRQPHESGVPEARLD